jgi:pimeloyl-ACP methyl ester carboxylesterase
MIRFKLNSILTIGAILAAVIPATNALAYFGSPGNQVAVMKANNTSPYGYYEYLPIGYSDSGSKVPVILFLHGIGERGNGNSELYKVAKVGPPKLAAAGKDFPAILLSPQTPTSGYWDKAAIDRFVNHIFATYKAADTNRLYITGLSMGGGGAWEYATAYASRIAAVVPVCGAMGGNRVALYGKGVWAFHAWNDTVVPLSRTTDNINTITPTSTSIMSGYPSVSGGAAASDMIALYSKSTNSHRWYTGNTTTDTTADKMIRYTVYRSGSHDAWTRAYTNNDMWNWLYRQVKATSATSTSTQILVDFGDNAVALPSGWNNGRGLSRSGSIALRTTTGVLTPYDLTTITGFNNVNRDGTKTPVSTLGFPAATTQDSFFGNDVVFGGVLAPKAVMEVRDLDPAKSYSFQFFASRMGVTDNRETRYRVLGATEANAYLNATGNTSKLTTAIVKPSSNGIVRIEITKGANNTNEMGAFYLGSMRIVY